MPGNKWKKLNTVYQIHEQHKVLHIITEMPVWVGISSSFLKASSESIKQRVEGNSCHPTPKARFPLILKWDTTSSLFQSPKGWKSESVKVLTCAGVHYHLNFFLSGIIKRHAAAFRTDHIHNQLLLVQICKITSNQRLKRNLDSAQL